MYYTANVNPHIPLLPLWFRAPHIKERYYLRLEHLLYRLFLHE